MYRSMVALVLVLLMSAPCLSQQSLVGTYKLVSVTRIIDGKQQEGKGKPPRGYLIVTPNHYIVFYTDGDRKYGASDSERAALWDTMTAFSGPYRFEKQDQDEWIPCILEPEGSSKEYRKNWARLIQKIYEVDPLMCPKCHGRMKIIAFIEDEEVIEKILKRKNTPTSCDFSS